MGCAKGGGMHPVLFSMKRAFHKSTWLGRAILSPYELTPSRFDVLYALRKLTRSHLWQSAIRRLLGVSAATTSIMVRALERLGFVRRRKSEEDRRQVEVSLTERGRDFITRAMATMQDQEIVDYFVHRVVVRQWWVRHETFTVTDRLENMLRVMRRRLGDRASLKYGMHPDD